MKDFSLHIYDWLSGRKWLAWTLLAVLVAVSAMLVTRMHYSEDISAFLPQDEMGARYRAVYDKLGGQDRMALLFSLRDTLSTDDEAGTIMDAMDAFASFWEETDTAGIVSDLTVCADERSILDVLDFVSANYPYFLDAPDYARMDSLLSDPDYIGKKVLQDRESLNLISSAVTSRYMRSDPLGLFNPVLERLNGFNPSASARMEDGYIFTRDGHTGVAFFTSPYGGNDSGRNGSLLALVERVKALTEEACPEVTVSCTGGPAVAVGNSSRIKKDSILAVSLALVLICLLLFFSYRRLSDVLWIAVSIVCGALFAVALIAVFKSTISIIVLGIGAMILGIAVNYPLHYVDHMKYEPDKRKALREQVTPLLVGNITTVGAFLSLLLLKAGALRDFGLVGALMLVGTIVFVLVFLPVLATGRREKATNALKLDFDRHIRLPRPWRKAVFIAFLVLTAVFAVLSGRISFDSDMHHINYMTPEQSRGFGILSSLGEDADGLDKIFVVAQGGTPEEALVMAEALGRSAICSFVPSSDRQQRRLEAWNAFRSKHSGLADSLAAEASKAGFAKSAFAPFNELWKADFTVQDVSYFSPVTSNIGRSMYLEDEDGVTVVGYVRVPYEDAEAVKAEISASAPDGAFCFDSSDVSGRLVSLLSDDFDKVGLICSLIVFIFLWLSFGRIEISVMSFLPLAVGWVWILGIMQLAGLRFNIVNIILATFIFGMGDDYTIFITEGLMYEYACGKKILNSYKNCVALSALIMFVGIGVLIVARHPAMRSLGEVTVVGMFVVVVMAYYLPPLVFRRLTSTKDGLRQVPVTLGRIWNSFLAIAFFLVTVLWLCPAVRLYFLIGRTTEEKKLRYHRFLQKLSTFIIKHIPGTEFSWSNPYGEDFSKPAVYICNHQSHFDVMAVMMLTPKVVILTNDWVWNNFFYGTLIHKAEFYPASAGIETNMERFRDLVARGYSILVFPEGTRSADCSIMRFQRGAFEMARSLGVDILPLYIHGFGYALPKKDFMLRKACMYMEVGRRVPLEELEAEIAGAGESLRSGDGLRIVTHRWRERYAVEYARIRRERETPQAVAPFVEYMYTYKGSDVLRECRRVLRKRVFAEISALRPEGGTLVIEDAGYGVYALLLALSRPDIEVFAHQRDEEKRLVAMRCAFIPSNLHYEK